ncbi:hypothetical protein [Marinibactrum halimedae]|uniref:Uncharacterized protein n=1 Tax=Marinibactrum halimedae TaxID=1444977 RepID=A0AA37WKV7_9GAMM|nr:hypothetical protein [Marinibactrum halimedae]MCD9458120.1 hypothetical protein [Marinibactrum halimedae]GLS25054.1 hypothetical protein GCM10007877_07680 [Marinibactrum halimedae]
MEKLQRKELEQIIGIYSPWTINDIQLDEEKERVNIAISQATEKPLLSFITKSSLQENQNVKRCEWQHIRFGRYTIFINTPMPDDASVLESASAPSFLGRVNKTYTHQLESLVAMAQAKSLDADATARLCQINVETVSKILEDLSASGEVARVALPSESDPIWRRIVLDQVHVKTKSLPLKLLLSKLKLRAMSGTDAQDVQQAVLELRSFFVQNAQRLKQECALLTGAQKAASSTKATAAPSRKLVLPGTQNKIWQHIIAGRLVVPSDNLPLRLMLSKLRPRFEVGSTEIRQSVVSEIRQFFYKNARSLKRELIFINQVLSRETISAISPGGELSLPDADHGIWSRILREEGFLPGNQMAYKLLLSQLRTRVFSSNDLNTERSAAQKLRSFFLQNQRLMHDELRFVLERASNQ